MIQTQTNFKTAPGKTKILTEICDRLKPNGLFLSHELLINGANTAVIRQDLAAIIRVN